MRVERQSDRLVDVLRGRRRDPHPVSAESIAERFAAVLVDVSQPLTPDQTRQIVLVDRRDGWLAIPGDPSKVRAQFVIWAFTPDGRLRRHPDRDARHGWDHYQADDEVDMLRRRWSIPADEQRPTEHD